jgi:trigger factor
MDAERRVKLGLILAEWGQANGVKVSREDLQGAIWADAARYGNPQEVHDFYNKNQNALSMMNGMLFERKALDAMISKCKIKS